MEKLINWLNTSYDSTRGNLLITVTVTVMLTMLLQAFFGSPVKKFAESSKGKILNIFKKILSKPFVKERHVYLKIIFNERIKTKKHGFTEDMPPGLSYKEYVEYKRKVQSGEKFAYQKLEDKIEQYQVAYSENLDEYYKNNPEAKKKMEAMGQFKVKHNFDDLINKL